MGEYQSRRPRSSQASAEAILGKETDGRSNSPSITVEGLAIKSAGEESIRGHGRDPPDADLCPPDSLGEDKERISTSLGESAGSSCDCGDPEMFRTVFDCHYHLPQEYRPVPSLAHCNYLFLQEETMYRCRDCHFDGSDIDVLSSEQQRQTDDTHRLDDAYEVYEQDRGCNTAPDIWICSRCFDPEQHRGHAIEESINHHNRGLYCHCGDPAILKNPPARSTAASAAAAAPSESETLYVCRDDHNRQNVLCTTDIKEGMPYYSCKIGVGSFANRALSRKPIRIIHTSCLPHQLGLSQSGVVAAKTVRSASRPIAGSMSVQGVPISLTGVDIVLRKENGSRIAGKFSESQLNSADE
ncbi:hypothetical protein BGX28_010195 [Mortierella sp. GBA30]|nr:hypothetical protein BGX28_010195 [Mortierella sp. GBA30]